MGFPFNEIDNFIGWNKIEAVDWAVLIITKIF